MTENSSGLVANIQRYSLNDGPGIRTTVFLKGCPLRCRWCHNVEMISPYNEVWYYFALCTCCGKCIEACPESALRGYKSARVIDRNICKGEACLRCVEVCPTHAMATVARRLPVREVLNEVRKDEIFYRHGGGGVTLSGGEPLEQPHFIMELLKECQRHSIHTTLDTCGYSNWSVLSEVAKHVDLVLFDIKHMNSAKHEWGTGVSNVLILENAAKLAKMATIRIRIPVVPGFNESEEELTEIAKFMKLGGLKDADLLPFHSYAEGKYKMYMKEYEFGNTHSPSEERIYDLKLIFEAHGVQVTIGG